MPKTERGKNLSQAFHVQNLSISKSFSNLNSKRHTERVTLDHEPIDIGSLSANSKRDG